MTNKLSMKRGRKVIGENMLKQVFYTDKDIDGMVHDIIRSLAKENWKPDYIVGITRGGLIPAIYISHYCDIKMETLKVSILSDDCESNCWMAEDAFNGKNILIIDDIVDKGKTFNWIKEDWQSMCFPDDPKWKNIWHNNVKFASLIYNEASEFPVDFYSESINKVENPVWITYPWEKWWRA